MKKFLTGIFIVLINNFGYAQPREYSIPYYPYETMDYSLKLGVIPIGTTHIEFGTNKDCGGSFIMAEAKSIGLAKFIKDIHYRFESCMDTITGLPKVASRIIKEDDYVNVNSVHYFHTLRPDSSVIYSEETDSVVVPKNLLDILTGFYHFRNNYVYEEKTLGNIDTITTFFINEVWDLILKYDGIETIETKNGDVECMKFMPRTTISRWFRTTEDMSFWLTNDGKYIPIKILVKLKFGSLIAELSSYSAPKEK